MVEAPPSTTALKVPTYINGPSRRPATRYSSALVARLIPPVSSADHNGEVSQYNERVYSTSQLQNSSTTDTLAARSRTPEHQILKSSLDAPSPF